VSGCKPRCGIPCGARSSFLLRGLSADTSFVLLGLRGVVEEVEDLLVAPEWGFGTAGHVPDDAAQAPPVTWDLRKDVLRAQG